MPQEPKKRHSKQRQGKRRHSINLTTQKGILCPNCAYPIVPHTVCKKCGYYKGAQVLTIKSAKVKES